MSETEQKSTDQKEQKIETTKEEVSEPVKEDHQPEPFKEEYKQEYKAEFKCDKEGCTDTNPHEHATRSMGKSHMPELPVSSDTTWEAVSKWIENKSNQAQLNSILVKVAARQEVLKPKPHSGSGLMLNK